MIRAIIQARMSSRRFPGKALAPFRGEPLILHVVRGVQQVKGLDSIVVATSTERSDDPLAVYLDKLGVNVFRGPLENVFQRFQLYVEGFPCDWILRICADSPLLNAYIVQKVVDEGSNGDCDLVSTTFPRTFPRGQNAELIRVNSFLTVDSSDLSADDREHVTSFYYRNAERFRIVNVESGNPELAQLNLAIDTVEDLHRLERLSSTDISLIARGKFTTVQPSAGYEELPLVSNQWSAGSGSTESCHVRFDMQGSMSSFPP